MKEAAITPTTYSRQTQTIGLSIGTNLKYQRAFCKLIEARGLGFESVVREGQELVGPRSLYAWTSNQRCYYKD